MKGSENLLFRLVRDPKGLTDAFYGSEKVEKTFWFCDLFIFYRQCIRSKLGMWKKAPLVNRWYTKGVPFLPNMAFKRVRGWTSGWSLAVKILVEYLLGPVRKRSLIWLIWKTVGNLRKNPNFLAPVIIGHRSSRPRPKVNLFRPS